MTYQRKEVIGNAELYWVIQRLAVVMLRVFRSGHYLQVLNPVVFFVFIYVVDYFRWQKRPANVPLHHGPVFA